MAEFIEIAGQSVQVPDEVVAEGRGAVDTWYKAHPGYIPTPMKELVTSTTNDKSEIDEAKAKAHLAGNAQQLKAAQDRVAKTASATSPTAPKGQE